MKFNLLTFIFMLPLYTSFRLLYSSTNHILFLDYFIYCNRLFYSHVVFLTADDDKFCLVEILDKSEFVNLSSPISLAFNFKCYFILLILINDKIRLSLSAACPSGLRKWSLQELSANQNLARPHTYALRTFFPEILEKTI